jgi:DNA-binding response OmpR family regulator
MTALAVARPITAIHPAEIRPRPRPASVGPAPVTVTISVDGGGVERERVLAALRDLIAIASPAAITVGASPPVGAAPVAVPDGAIRLDPAPRTAIRDGFLLHLSRLEYDLLLFLASHPHQVFSRGQLLAQVWGHSHATGRTVDVHVSRLRRKLGDQELITTVYGLGYRLADDAPVAVTRP